MKTREQFDAELKAMKDEALQSIQEKMQSIEEIDFYAQRLQFFSKFAGRIDSVFWENEKLFVWCGEPYESSSWGKCVIKLLPLSDLLDLLNAIEKSRIIKVTSDYDGEKAHYFGRVYLHGELDERMGTDLCGLLNPEDFEVINEESKLPTYEVQGIFPCKVEGVEEPCTAFLWLVCDSARSSNEGLIVLNSDKEGNEYAQECYERECL